MTVNKQLYAKPESYAKKKKEEEEEEEKKNYLDVCAVSQWQQLPGTQENTAR